MWKTASDPQRGRLRVSVEATSHGPIDSRATGGLRRLVAVRLRCKVSPALAKVRVDKAGLASADLRYDGLHGDGL